MAIPLLDLRAQWGKIKAGFRDGPFFKGARRGPNPSGYRQGPTAEAMAAQQSEQALGKRQAGVFGGKTFSERKK